jgi:SAM-dependent methyltransferase
MDQVQQGQVTNDAAEIYEELFVPALFDQWATRVVEAARINDGQQVLDVACGTGVLARAAKQHVGDAGSVVGLDVNPGMLAVAQRKGPSITWEQGRAESLPFEDHQFDAVVSQFGFMFFEDRHKAVAEVIRVLRPGGRLAIAVWDSLENTPGYAAMVALLDDLFGANAAEGLRAPYNMGNAATFRSYFDRSDLIDVQIQTLAGMARFESIEQWVYTDIKGWVLSDSVDDAQFKTLVDRAIVDLAAYVTDTGNVAFAAPAHILSARKRQ